MKFHLSSDFSLILRTSNFKWRCAAALLCAVALAASLYVIKNLVDDYLRYEIVLISKVRKFDINS